MINIMNVFFDLYENKEIAINWNRNNPSFHISDGPVIISKIARQLEKNPEIDEVTESDIVDSIFLIINNRIRAYYKDPLANYEENIETTNYIENNMNKELLNDINMNIFLDNNIIDNRLNRIRYETITKRDSDNVNKIQGYTSKLVLESIDSQENIQKVQLELKIEELDEMISVLKKARKDASTLINGEE